MRLHIAVLLIAVLIILLNGCTGYGTYMVTSEKATPTNEKDIRVYSLTEPTGNYEVLGYISVYKSDAQDEGNKLKENLKKKAAELGANAIISFKLNQSISGGGGAEGVAIKFK